MQFNIADLFESLVDAIPERTAVVCGARRLSFAGLDARANRLASFLRSRGVGPGDHVGLHLYNGTEFLEGMLACFKLRAVPINVNYRYVAQELRYLCENADLVAIVSERELADVLSPAIGGLTKLRTTLLVGDAAQAPPGSEVFGYEAALAQGSAARDFGPRSGDDLYIIYTGGTTGMPKGVMWRHEDVFFAGLQGGRPGGTPIERPEELASPPPDAEAAMTILPAAPFIHGAAQWGALIGLFTGGKVVLQGGRSFDAARVWQLVGEERVTTITLVGDAMARPLVEALEASASSYDTSTLFVIASAGAVLSPTIRERLRELLPGAMVLNNFGATETGHQGTALPGSEAGAEGRPSFYMDPSNTVLDDALSPIEPGSGKIGRVARGGRIPLGYYGDPEKTAERFVESGGTRWCIPGDFATIESDGRITVFGRGNMCINTGGEKVFPEEVEEALKAHPDVFDAVVVGVPDERWMQRVAAVVELRAGRMTTLENLQAHCRNHIAGYKVPRQLTVVPRIERQPSGKPDYGWAREVAVRHGAG
jgi:acyl-CoA synthetase (AMP-forming)/AMP-acid ligase II